MLAVTGCFGRGDAEAEVSSEPAQAEVQPEAAAADTPTPAAAGIQSTDSEEAVAAASEGAIFTTIEDAAEIQSYRMRVSMNTNSAGGAAQVEITGEYTKEPRAERLTMHFDEGGEVNNMEILLVEGVRYAQFEGMWVAAPDMVPDIQELTLITPADLQEMPDGVVEVGTENVNGRQTTHYHGDKETIPVVGAAGDTLDVSQVEDAQIDFWVDQAANFLVKMQLTVNGEVGNPDTVSQIIFEYFDFNADMAIEKPENVMAIPGMGQAADEQPAAAPLTSDDEQAGATTSALGALLGFDLMLPTGSDFSLMGSNMAQLTTPYTAEEAVNLFTQTMPANGYTLMSQLNPEAGQTVLMFQKGVKIITINITAADGGSEMQIVSAP
ncbi:MAG: hypothetical protein R2911_30255 [Caldilineaceae bacterium]